MVSNEVMRSHDLNEGPSQADLPNKSMDFLKKGIDEGQNAAKLAEGIKGDSELTEKMGVLKQKFGKKESLKDNDDLLKQFETFDKKILDVKRLGDATEYSSQNVISQLSDKSKEAGCTDVKVADVSVDSNGLLLSVGVRGITATKENVGLSFYRNCDCKEFFSDKTCIIKEYYDDKGQVTWADPGVDF